MEQKYKYNLIITNQFKKDLRRIRKRNYDLQFLKKVVYMLENDIEVPASFHNHLLEPKSNRIMGMPYTA